MALANGVGAETARPVRVRPSKASSNGSNHDIVHYVPGFGQENEPCYGLTPLIVSS